MQGRQEVDLNGITYHELSIEDHLAEKTEKKTRSVLKEQIEEKKKSMYHEDKSRREGETKRVSKRVTHWSANKIRGVYGIMKKPYKTHVENILWVIKNKGPISSGLIELELDKRQYSLSSQISAIWKRLNVEQGSQVLTRERKGEGNRTHWEYRLCNLGTEMTVEQLHKDYIDEGHDQRVIVGGKKKAANKTKAKAGEEKKQELYSHYLSDGGMANKRLMDSVGDVLSQTLGVEVKVSGEIKILFGLVK